MRMIFLGHTGREMGLIKNDRNTNRVSYTPWALPDDRSTSRVGKNTKIKKLLNELK